MINDRFTARVIGLVLIIFSVLIDASLPTLSVPVSVNRRQVPFVRFVWLVVPDTVDGAPYAPHESPDSVALSTVSTDPARPEPPSV